MIIFAAIVPPHAALQAVEDFVRGVDAEPIKLRPPEEINLPIARFGNTTLNDAERLIAALRDAASDWKPTPRLSLGGGQVTETRTERTLEVGIQGEVDELTAFALDIKETAQHLRFLLDRRDLRPFLTLATVRPDEGAGFDEVANALATFEGEPWQVTQVSMRKHTYGDGGDSEEIASIDLTSA